MRFDFFTIYTAIGFFSLAMLLAWVVVALSLPGLRAARYWLASALVGVVGGLLMAAGDEPRVMLPIYLGNAVIILGFGLAWNGLRSFHGLPPRWPLSLAHALLCLALVLLVQEDRHARQVVYAVGQGLPLLLTMRLLLRHRQGRLVALLAVTGIAVSLLAHAGKLLASALLDRGGLAPEHYLQAETTAVLAVMCGGVLWKLGLLLMAMDQARLEMAALSLRDELTGLSNRRHFLDRLAEEEARARRGGPAFTLLLLDLDHFKRVNDTQGHAAGDECLRHVAALLRERLRRGDVVARLGGDEFGALLPGTGLAQAESVARALNELIRRRPARWKGEALPVTLSIGLAAWQSDWPGETAAQLQERADGALYAVKRQGRDGHAVAPRHAAPSRASAA